MTEWIKLRKINGIYELKKYGYDFLLNDYGASKVFRNWFDTHEEGGSPPEHCMKASVPIAVVVHGRLFIEQANVLLELNNRNAWITDEDYQKLL